jgi:hypothetical protein
MTNLSGKALISLEKSRKSIELTNGGVSSKRLPQRESLAYGQVMDSKMSGNEIARGDTVRIAKDATPEMRPGAFAEICGIRDANAEIHLKPAVKLYLVEFGDGHSIEVPEHLVERA